MVKITNEMKNVIWDGIGAENAIKKLAPLIIAQYEAEKVASAAPVPFEITSMNQKLRFRDGTPARLLAVDLAGPYCVASYNAATENIRVHLVSGKLASDVVCNSDLIPIPLAERVAYVNVYPHSSSVAYRSRGIADNVAAETRIGCNRIVLKEGVWDD
jgi:hypothetical protein